MWNPFKKKGSEQAPADPAGVHPKHKQAAVQPVKPADPSMPAKTDATTARASQNKPEPKNPPKTSRSDGDDLRQYEFEQIGIPYKRVLLAEAQKVKGINAKNLVETTQNANSDLKHRGFDFQITCLEFFESQLLHLDYERKRALILKTERRNLPEHKLIDVIVLREAERRIRQKRGLKENPVPGPDGQIFQNETKELFDRLWNNSQLHQLKNQAVLRIRREKKLKGGEPVLEAEVVAMMEKIKTELQAPQKIGRR